MNNAERQALRDKHHIDWDALYGSMTMCVECYDLYPCDVIKVLDAWEAERKAIVDALSHGHREMYEIVNEIAKKIGGH